MLGRTLQVTSFETVWLYEPAKVDEIHRRGAQADMVQVLLVEDSSSLQVITGTRRLATGEAKCV